MNLRATLSVLAALSLPAMNPCAAQTQAALAAPAPAPAPTPQPALAHSPGVNLAIRSLGKGASGPLDKAIHSLALLGSSGKIAYTQDAQGLHVPLPGKPPAEGACALKLTLE